MNKRELARWLENEREEALRAENKAFEEKVNLMKDTLTKTSGMNDMAAYFVDTCKKWAEDFLKWTEEHKKELGLNSYYCGSIVGAIDDISPFDIDSFVKKVWNSSVDIERIPQYVSLNNSHRANRDNISSTYNNVIYNIKMCKNCKEAVEYLTSLGFTVPESEKTSTALMAPIDTKYLYLKH